MTYCNEDSDADILEDLINLSFEDNPTRINNLQILDPGIIDLDSDSEEDCKYIPNSPDAISPSRDATNVLSVVNPVSNSAKIKPMRVSLVDCYKFPSYFDEYTRNIIHKILDSEKIMNSNSKNLIHMTNDVYKIKDIDVAMNYKNECTNSVSQMSANSTEFKNKNDNNESKSIDLTHIHKRKKKKFDDNNIRLAKKEKRTDRELQKALNQRNKTKVDFKKNTGLVGMKVFRLPTKNRSIMKIKNKPSITQTETNKDIIQHEEINILYEQALSNIGTSITPVFKQSLSCDKSEPSKCESQDSKTECNVKSLNNKCYLKIEKTTEIDNIVNESKCISSQQDNEEKKIITQDDTIFEEIAKELVWQVNCQKEEQSHIIKKPSVDTQKSFKASANTVKENDENKIIVKDIELKHPKNTKAYKMTKMITPIPIPTKASKKKKLFLAQRQEIYETKESKSPIVSSSMLKENRKNMTKVKNKEHDINNLNHEIKNNDTCSTENAKQNTCFSNKYTENILKRAQQQKLLEINRIKQAKSTDNSSLAIPKTNVTSINNAFMEEKVYKNVKQHLSFLEETAKDISDKKNSDVAISPPSNISDQNITQINKNHLEFLPQVANSILYLDGKCPPSITNQKTVKKYDTTSIPDIPVHKKQSYETNITNSVHKSNTDTEQSSTKNSTDKYEKNTEHLRHKRNSKVNVVPVHPVTTAIQTITGNFPIQTIVTSRNVSDSGTNNNTGATYLPIYHHPPNLQVSSVVTRPIQELNYQSKITKKPLIVHNSICSHILYRPHVRPPLPPPQMNPIISGTLRYQAPIPHMNQQSYSDYLPYNYIQYPPTYPAGTSQNIRTMLSLGVIAGNFQQMGNPSCSQHSSLDVRPTLDCRDSRFKHPRGNEGPSQIPRNTKTSDGQGGISHSVSKPGKNGNIPPEIIRKIPSSTGDKVILQQTNMNVSSSTNASLPPTNDMNVRFRDMNNIWHHAFPPLDQSPPLQQSSNNLTRSQFNFEDSSVIGRNQNGIIKKIIITAPVVDQNLIQRNTEYLQKNTTKMNLDQTSIEISKVLPNSSSPTLQSNTSTQRINSPLEHFDCTNSKSLHDSSKELRPLEFNSSSTGPKPDNVLLQPKLTMPIDPNSKYDMDVNVEHSKKYKKEPVANNLQYPKIDWYEDMRFKTAFNKYVKTTKTKQTPQQSENNPRPADNLIKKRTLKEFDFMAVPQSERSKSKKRHKDSSKKRHRDSSNSHHKDSSSRQDVGENAKSVTSSKAKVKFYEDTHLKTAEILVGSSKIYKNPLGSDAKETAKSLTMPKEEGHVISHSKVADISVSNSKRQHTDPSSRQNVGKNTKCKTNSKKIDSSSLENILKRVSPEKKECNIEGFVNLKRSVNEATTVLSTCKYKPGPLSKKLKFKDSRETLEKTKSRETNLAENVYTPPNLVKDLRFQQTPHKKKFERPCSLYHSCTTDDQLINDNVNSFPQRDEEAKVKNKERDQMFQNHVEYAQRRASNVDSDLGYDSDITVKL